MYVEIHSTPLKLGQQPSLASPKYRLRGSSLVLGPADSSDRTPLVPDVVNVVRDQNNSLKFRRSLILSSSLLDERMLNGYSPWQLGRGAGRVALSEGTDVPNDAHLDRG